MMRGGVAWLLIVALAGCGGSSGPPSTDTSSASLPSLAERVEFLQRYVTFRRGYRELDFQIRYTNNSGGVPGPSYWDIRVVAVVPPNEVELWIPAGVTPEPEPDVSWLKDVPGVERAAGIREWYVEGIGRVIGVDRAKSVVAYRLLSN